MSCLKNQEYMQSQYSSSPTIKKILKNFGESICPSDDIKLLFDNIINIETATGVGLDYWGRIVGVRREIFTDATTTTDPLLGFTGSELDGFNQGIFVTLDNLQTGNRVIATLSDDQFRRLILFKALANISHGDMAMLNKISKELFDTEDLLVANIINEGTLPNGDKYNTTPMAVRWVWRTNSITNIDRELFTQYIEMSLPAGVQYLSNIVSKDPLFGFAGSNLNGFNQGAFVIVENIERRSL